MSGNLYHLISALDSRRNRRHQRDMLAETRRIADAVAPRPAQHGDPIPAPAPEPAAPPTPMPWWPWAVLAVLLVVAAFTQPAALVGLVLIGIGLGVYARKRAQRVHAFYSAQFDRGPNGDGR